MSHMSESPNAQPGAARPAGPYNVDSHIVDFILGITYEIWEQRQVEKILNYYLEDIEVYSLENITFGAEAMVQQTYETLDAFPDRLLLADEVITSGDVNSGYSSHRIISPMTNLGDTAFGPATGRQIRTMNIADCEISNGQITGEWLVRDNFAMVLQLGFDPAKAAQKLAGLFEKTHKHWLHQQFERTSGASVNEPRRPSSGQQPKTTQLARRVLEAYWLTGDSEYLNSVIAPYCVLHRAPKRIFSGRTAMLDHYQDWRIAFPEAHLTVDNVCCKHQEYSDMTIAARWSFAGTDSGGFAGNAATGKDIYVLGVTHWEVVDDRIVAEWTVFDELAVMAQAFI